MIVGFTPMARLLHVRLSIAFGIPWCSTVTVTDTIASGALSNACLQQLILRCNRRVTYLDGWGNILIGHSREKLLVHRLQTQLRAGRSCCTRTDIGCVTSMFASFNNIKAVVHLGSWVVFGMLQNFTTFAVKRNSKFSLTRPYCPSPSTDR